MSLRTSVKIIAPTPLAKATVAPRAVVAAACFLWIGAALPSPSHAGPVFDRSSFNSIRFSENCTQKQWSVSSDDSLVLLIAPSAQGPCEATLEFYFPQELGERPALNFEARSLHPGFFLKAGVQEQANVEVLYTPLLPEEGLATDWTSQRTRLNYLKPAGTLAAVTALHFVASADPSTPLVSRDTVMIRGIHLSQFGAAAAAVPPAPEADVTPTPTKDHSGTIVPQHLFPAFPSSFSLRTAARKMVWPVAALTLLVLATTQKSRRRRILSPLYEVNMRTWKTRRDANDVVQYGGFKNVTLSDLKTMKQAGFNTMWLMGIWEIGQQVRAVSQNYAPDFQGSPFAIQDYAVSSDLGTDQEFRELVQRAHSLRLSVIVDFIPNHMGMDSAWLNDHPEYFIHRVLEESEAGLSDEELKHRYPGYFPYRTPSYPEGQRRVPKTIMVSYGKDPYFYPWIDTAQLDYAHPGLRQKMIDTLCHWAKIVDGVRCDMAMLVLREQVKIHRHPNMSWEAFNQQMPNEFWTEAIQAAKKVNPHFVFMAETYWSMEGHLQNIGFDYTYNKPLYEAICSAVHNGHAEGLMNFLRLLGTDFLKRSVHFLENHDEERAMNAIGEERQRAAGTILCTLPGIALLHQGQMEGKRERLPVQRVVPLHQEPELTKLQHFYQKLLKATSLPVFQEGRLIPLYSNNPAFASYARLDDQTKVLVIVNTSSKTQKGTLFLMPGLRLHSGASYRLKDLFFDFKTNTAGTVQPFYDYTGAKLINQGLYVELEPFDGHIFVVEPQQALLKTQQMFHAVRHSIEEWPLNRLTRRVLGAAFTRSSDLPVEQAGLPTRETGTHLAANPTGRQS